MDLLPHPDLQARRISCHAAGRRISHLEAQAEDKTGIDLADHSFIGRMFKFPLTCCLITPNLEERRER